MDKEKEIEDEIKKKLTLYEVARLNMVSFSEHYIKNDNMTKKEWFDIQKKVLEDLKQVIEKNKEKNE